MTAKLPCATSIEASAPCHHVRRESETGSPDGLNLPVGKQSYDFTPAWWLPGPHLQTLWPPLTRRRPSPPYQRELCETPDGDELVLDHLAPSDSWRAPPRGRVFLMHGLEGSSQSVHIGGMALRLARRGWAVTAYNFRSCALEFSPDGRLVQRPNRRPRLYHSGDTADIAWLVRRHLATTPGVPMAAAGISMGANALLKWLGEDQVSENMRAAVTVSAPFDLMAGALHLECAAGRWYTGTYLGPLRSKLALLVERFPEVRERLDLERAHSVTDFRHYDDAVTAPLHGFSGVADYYERCNSLALLPRIRTPTLCLNALDDPFQPPDALERARRAASGMVQVKLSRSGGHVGFVSGSWPWSSLAWAEEAVARFIDESL